MHGGQERKGCFFFNETAGRNENQNSRATTPLTIGRVDGAAFLVHFRCIPYVQHVGGRNAGRQTGRQARIAAVLLDEADESGGRRHAQATGRGGLRHAIVRFHFDAQILGASALLSNTLGKIQISTTRSEIIGLQSAYVRIPAAGRLLFAVRTARVMIRIVVVIVGGIDGTVGGG